MKNSMKNLIVLVVYICLTANAYAQNSTLKNQNKMKLNAGIVTKNLVESKEFYTHALGFGVTFENEFYLLMHTPDRQAEISFLLPNHPSQQLIFQTPFQGQGVYLTIEVDDVDKIYKELKSKGIKIVFELRDEPWGDRHFAVQDPNGVNIDIVRFTPTNE
jgi:catechol 2,3-dioxygenase-like lactoylglutathione lyase family enzyme